MKKTYRARPGARFGNEDAEKFGHEIERLKNENGPLTTAAIVESARSPESPLHNYFEWDDSTAAESWRMAQARHLVNRIEVVIEKNGEEIVVPFMVNVIFKKNDNEPLNQGYVTVEEAMTTKEYREQVIQDILNQIKILGAKAAAFRDLAEILSKTASRIQRLFEKEKKNGKRKKNSGRSGRERDARHRHAAEL